jgi:hypothetical protein
MHYQRGGDKTNGDLPAYVRDALDNWPASGTGDRLVHRHILRLANMLRHYIDDPGAAGELIRGKMPRRAKPGEIEEALERAYNLESTPKLDRTPPRHLADPLLIDQIVAEHFSGQSLLEELRQRSPFPIPDSTDEIIRTLYPADSLICVGRDPGSAFTAPLRNFRTLATKELIVPSPMTAIYSVDAEGGKHKRSLPNTGPGRFIVTDFDIKPTDNYDNPTIYFDLVNRWKAAGVSIQDGTAALISYLSGPLVMVVYSGNLSLQAWWYAEGEDESLDSRMRAFFETAVILGADRAGWITCQLFRMPGGLRSSTNRRQSVHYFNPSLLR